MKLHRLTVAVFAVLTVSGAAVWAQEPTPVVEPQPPGSAFVRGARGPVVPLEVQVVISRYQGEKKVSSMPYVLAVNANSANSQLNVGAEVPVPSTTFTAVGGADKTPLTSFNYKNIGTNIDSSATTADDGRFELNLSVDENSVVTNAEASGGIAGGAPVFRSFRSRNRLLLRDGQTRQYTAATDRVNGETIRIDVTLRVLK